MRIIVSGDSGAKSHLEKLGTTTRLGVYNVEVPIDEGWLVFNTFTCQLLFLSQEEYSDSKRDEDSLTYEEAYSLVNNYRKKNMARYPISKFVILTTSECNARCFYCFENGHRLKASMSSKVADDVSAYVERTVDGRKAHLSWFGGEPLLNIEAIDSITNNLVSHNIAYYSSMITNASLIDESVLDKMVNLWKMRWVQITIDGTEDVYNKTKNYSNNTSGISPYRIVINSIKGLIEKKIHVLISLRVNCSNGESLSELIDEIEKEFGINKYLSVMCAAIHEKKIDKYEPRSIEEEHYVRRHQILLMEKAFKMGLFRPALPKKPRIFHCNSDNGSEIIILPNGKLGWCNNFIDSRYIGDIYNNILDERTISWFQERYEDCEECKTCTLYPQCTRLKACEGSTPICTEEQRLVSLKSIEIAMINRYLIR